jgi:hypothetical protein
MIALETKTVQLSTGQSFTVAENDAPASNKLHRLREEATTSLNGDTSALGHFRKNIFPILAATAQGDMPDVMAAYALPRAELDAWWLDVWLLNADWIDIPFEKEAITEVVEFRDGSSLTLAEARGLPSFILRWVELEDQAVKNPSEDKDFQAFRTYVYPRMAACVIEGNVPPADEVWRWPTVERLKWYNGARRTNSDWFLPLEGEAEQALKEKEKEQKKKGARKPAG